LSASNISY